MTEDRGSDKPQATNIELQKPAQTLVMFAEVLSTIHNELYAFYLSLRYNNPRWGSVQTRRFESAVGMLRDLLDREPSIPPDFPMPSTYMEMQEQQQQSVDEFSDNAMEDLRGIYSFNLRAQKGVQTLYLPRNGIVRSVQPQAELICLLIEYAPNEPTEQRAFELYTTGQLWDIHKRQHYCGSAQIGAHVWHVFEQR